MSFLKNSDFEDSTEAPWAPFNKKGSVIWSTNLSIYPLTGSKTGSIMTNNPGGSIAQDVTISAEHVSAFAFVRSATGAAISGMLAIWNLNIPLMLPSSTPFTVSNAAGWELVTNSGFAIRPGSIIRVELYVLTVNEPLLIDQVNAI